jgi:hypothetical protein
MSALHEFLEDAGAVVLRHTGALVAHGDPRDRALVFDRDQNLAAARREFHRIGEKIDDDLRHPVRIDANHSFG